MEQSAQLVDEQSEVLPGFPSVHFRDVPWYRKTSVFIPIFFLNEASEKSQKEDVERTCKRHTASKSYYFR